MGPKRSRDNEAEVLVKPALYAALKGTTVSPIFDHLTRPDPLSDINETPVTAVKGKRK